MYRAPKEYKHIGQSYKDDGFLDNVKELLLYHKIVSVNKVDSRIADIILDNGLTVRAVGNDGCEGCGSGIFELQELNNCDNVITNVELSVEPDDYIDDKDFTDFVFHLFVYAEDKKVNVLTYSGYDNGWYGIGYDLYVKI